MLKKRILSTVIICCFMIATHYIYGEQKSAPISVDTLFNGLQAGAISLKFDDPVIVTGYVLETGISKYATPYVAVSDKQGGRQYAVCVLPRTDSLKLKDFTKDEKVIIEGNFYRLSEDKVVIKKCRKLLAK